MPPKRKRGLSHDHQGSSANAIVPAPVVKKPPETEARGDTVLLDMWTDEQEACLLKAVIRWKPVGMHKHFRMTNIYDFMRDQGVISPTDKHTTIAGIWAKLDSWYNLPMLDEREDSLTFDNADAQNISEDWSRNFTLPDDEYRDMMFQRRLNPDGSQSPPVMTKEYSRRESIVADTDEVDSSPAQGQNRRPLRGTRGRRQAAEKSSPPSVTAQTLEDTTMEETEHGSAAGEEDSSLKRGRTRNARAKPANRSRGGRRGGR